MIWTGGDSRNSYSQSEDPIQRRVNQVCEDAALDSAYSDEVSKAIAAFVQDEEGDAGTDLARLTAHVLHQLGEEDASRCVLVAHAGVTRVDSWMVAGDQPVIVVDVIELVAGKGANLEAGLFNSLNVVFNTLWRVGEQYSQGFRVGIRGLMKASALILGDEAPLRAVQALAQEVMVHCQARLQRAEGESPVVFSLDID